MLSGTRTLADLPPGDVGLTCATCRRSARYPHTHLIAEMGGETTLPDALRALTALWCRAERKWSESSCGARWDR